MRLLNKASVIIALLAFAFQIVLLLGRKPELEEIIAVNFWVVIVSTGLSVLLYLIRYGALSDTEPLFDWELGDWDGDGDFGDFDD